jgi:hypothetical protein
MRGALAPATASSNGSLKSVPFSAACLATGFLLVLPNKLPFIDRLAQANEHAQNEMRDEAEIRFQ